MKINVPDIATVLIELGVPFEAQAKYLQAAVGRVVGYLLPIPAEPVASTSAFYTENLAPRVATALDALTERVPLDYAATLALVQQVWEVRYGLVHPQTNAQAWALLDACVKQARIIDVDFADGAVQRLASVLSAGVEQ
jgi:hypothetical protein